MRKSLASPLIALFLALGTVFSGVSTAQAETESYTDQNVDVKTTYTIEDDPGPYKSGEKITSFITLENTGSAIIDNIEGSDDYSAFLTEDNFDDVYFHTECVPNRSSPGVCEEFSTLREGYTPTGDSFPISYFISYYEINPPSGSLLKPGEKVVFKQDFSASIAHNKDGSCVKDEVTFRKYNLMTATKRATDVSIVRSVVSMLQDEFNILCSPISVNPTVDPSGESSGGASDGPSTAPTDDATIDPTINPTVAPTMDPSIGPSEEPTVDPTVDPTDAPTVDPTVDPSDEPTADPTDTPTVDPTANPTDDPTTDPSEESTDAPTADPSEEPTVVPTADPTVDPTADPTDTPTVDPTADSSDDPTADPSEDPTVNPTVDPTTDPADTPTVDPSKDPTMDPSEDPSGEPSEDPSNDPSSDPSDDPSGDPSEDPSEDPSGQPSDDPTDNPSAETPSSSPHGPLLPGGPADTPADAPGDGSAGGSVGGSGDDPGLEGSWFDDGSGIDPGAGDDSGDVSFGTGFDTENTASRIGWAVGSLVLLGLLAGLGAWSARRRSHHQ